MSNFMRFPDELIHVSLTLFGIYIYFFYRFLVNFASFVSLRLTTPRLEFVIADACGRTNSEGKRSWE